MNEEEKEAIEELKETIKYIDKNGSMYCDNEDKDNMRILLNLIEKQQKEIEEQKEQLDGRYYHSVKLRELEIAIEEDWRNKIKKLKEKVEKERISNPYDFSYMLKELLGE